MIRREAPAALLELGAQFDEIVDLAVEDHAKRAVRRPHGLRAALDVDHGEPTVAQEQRAALVAEEALAVRPPVGERAGHPRDVGPVAGTDETRDPAHQGAGSTLNVRRTR